MRDCALNILQHQSALKAWSDWSRVREEAISHGLQPVINALIHLNSGEISAAEIFETAYCRWFASWMIDSEPLLHNFVPAEHMSDIEAYRAQTDRLAKLTVRYIRARLCGVIPAKMRSASRVVLHCLNMNYRNPVVINRYARWQPKWAMPWPNLPPAC
jgi:hypothetical protein